jgi:phenylalanyl-tRNA synthetase alpha chain
MPSDALDYTRTDFPALGANDAAGIGLLFAQLKSNFLADLKRATERGQWEEVRDNWSGPAGGVPQRIAVNWVQKAPENLKPLLSRERENLISFINIRLQTSQTLQQLGVNHPDQVPGRFADLRKIFDTEIQQCVDEVDLGIDKIRWLSRKSGVIAQITEKWLKPSSPELKRTIGQELNSLRAHVEAVIEKRQQAITAAAESAELARERADLSLPGVIRPIGSRHLVRQTFEEIERIFLSLGFTVVEGNEIETPYYNFEALNIPEHHPARDTMDTFYLDLPRGSPPHLLRTHTSPMQIHTMERQQPPVRIIVPGKVYRRDNPDATHSYVFHQVEGLAVDTDITFCEFKGTVEYFVREFLGSAIKTRLRPSYFPFTEPSVEVDASCFACMGRGCRLCKFSGWIELFGAGMVDPAVYGFVNYDARRVSGYAFGMGVDRLSQLKYGIDDVQLFFQNDVRFLRQLP